MEKLRRLLICSVVGFFGLLAAALALVADAKRVQVSKPYKLQFFTFHGTQAIDPSWLRLLIVE